MAQFNISYKYIELGHAPLQVINYFNTHYQQPLAMSLKELLCRRSFCHSYFFETSTNYVQWNMPIFDSDDNDELQSSLSCLDEFVWQSRLDSRAAAIEMLMFSKAKSTCDAAVQATPYHVTQFVNADFDQTSNLSADKLKNVSLQSTNNIQQSDEVIEETKLNTSSFRCAVCGKNNKSISSLQRHLKNHTNKERRHCTFCNKSFLSYHSLVTHERTHTGEKPFQCETCGRSFNQNRDLKNHIKTHSEKQHKCEECGLTFTLLRGLKDHWRAHTGERRYVCEVCGRSYLRQCNLTDHMTSHTGDKPYKCRFCPKTFRKTCSKIKHERIHSGERPFVCSVCNKTFTQNYNLKVHMRTHKAKDDLPLLTANTSDRLATLTRIS